MSYHHIQRAPLMILLYGLALLFFAVGVSLRDEPPLPWLFPPIGALMLVLAASFHYLQVEDQGDRLLVSFGPLPLFRRAIRYHEMVSVEPSQTTLLDGWGIHYSFRGGWVWNLWGRDCVKIQLERGVLWLGTDEPVALTEFLKTRLRSPSSEQHHPS